MTAITVNTYLAPKCVEFYPVPKLQSNGNCRQDTRQSCCQVVSYQQTDLVGFPKYLHLPHRHWIHRHIESLSQLTLKRDKKKKDANEDGKIERIHWECWKLVFEPVPKFRPQIPQSIVSLVPKKYLLAVWEGTHLRRKFFYPNRGTCSHAASSQNTSLAFMTVVSNDALDLHFQIPPDPD